MASLRNLAITRTDLDHAMTPAGTPPPLSCTSTPTTPHLTVTPASWSAFLRLADNAGVLNSEVDCARRCPILSRRSAVALPNVAA